MAIAFTGDFVVARKPGEVYDFLSDPNRFGPLLPDFQSMTVQDAEHFTVKVMVGISHIRGAAELKMTREQAVRPLKAAYSGQGSVAGGSVKLRAGFDLNPEGEGTRVVWKGEAQIFGPLASMAGGLLEPLGKKNLQKLIDGLQRALSENPAGEAP
jgi:carbon monoxide dehydrogenase subunit G